MHINLLDYISRFRGFWSCEFVEIGFTATLVNIVIYCENIQSMKWRNIFLVKFIIRKYWCGEVNNGILPKLMINNGKQNNIDVQTLQDMRQCWLELLYKIWIMWLHLLCLLSQHFYSNERFKILKNFKLWLNTKYCCDTLKFCVCGSETNIITLCSFTIQKRRSSPRYEKQIIQINYALYVYDTKYSP